MKSQITFSEKISLTLEEQSKIQDIIEWKEPPNMIRTGRSGYLKTEKPLSDANIQLVKFKGLGFFNSRDNSRVKPGTDIYDGSRQMNEQGFVELANRLVVDENGKFQLVSLGEKPFGGQYMERVDVEFNAAETLPPNITYIPVAKAYYEDLRFNEKPIGVTILGLPTSNLTFFEEYFVFQLQEEKMMMSSRLNPHSTPDQIFELLTGFCHQLGHKIRLLHEHFVAIEGHFANFTIIPETAEILIHDLDFVSPVSSLSPIQEFNYRIRDIASTTTALLTNLLFNDLLHYAQKLESYDSNYFGFNMLTAIIEGYEDSLSDEVFEKIEAFTDKIWKELLQFYLEEVQGLSGRERLLKIHPFVVQKKLQTLDGLYEIMHPVFEKESKDIGGYTKKDHQENLQQLFSSLSSE